MKSNLITLQSLLVLASMVLAGCGPAPEPVATNTAAPAETIADLSATFELDCASEFVQVTTVFTGWNTGLNSKCVPSDKGLSVASRFNDMIKVKITFDTDDSLIKFEVFGLLTPRCAFSTSDSNAVYGELSSGEIKLEGTVAQLDCSSFNGQRVQTTATLGILTNTIPSPIP